MIEFSEIKRVKILYRILGPGFGGPWVRWRHPCPLAFPEPGRHGHRGPPFSFLANGNLLRSTTEEQFVVRLASDDELLSTSTKRDCGDKAKRRSAKVRKYAGAAAK